MRKYGSFYGFKRVLTAMDACQRVIAVVSSDLAVQTDAHFDNEKGVCDSLSRTDRRHTALPNSVHCVQEGIGEHQRPHSGRQVWQSGVHADY